MGRSHVLLLLLFAVSFTTLLAQEIDESSGVNLKSPKRKLGPLYPKATVYYEIHSNFSKKEKKVLECRIKCFKKRSSIKYIVRTNQPNYVQILKAKNSGACGWVYGIGYAPGKRRLYVDQNCISSATIIHEFMHHLGFDHEDMYSNRTNYCGWAKLKSNKPETESSAKIASKMSVKPSKQTLKRIAKFAKKAKSLYFCKTRNKTETQNKTETLSSAFLALLPFWKNVTSQTNLNKQPEVRSTAAPEVPAPPIQPPFPSI